MSWAKPTNILFWSNHQNTSTTIYEFKPNLSKYLNPNSLLYLDSTKRSIQRYYKVPYHDGNTNWDFSQICNLVIFDIWKKWETFYMSLNISWWEYGNHLEASIVKIDMRWYLKWPTKYFYKLNNRKYLRAIAIIKELNPS